MADVEHASGQLRIPQGVGVVTGSANGAMRLRRRTATGSSPTSAANRSIARSIAAVASGRPAPRYPDTGVVVVTTERTLHSTRATS